MYKYFKELENPDDFYIYLCDTWILNSVKKIKYDFSLEFVKKNQDLFEKLKELDKMILGHNKKFGYPLFMRGDRRYTLSEVYYYREDLQITREECGLEEIILITNTNELIQKLEEYEVYCNYFMILYPNLKDYFEGIKHSIENALNQFVMLISLPPRNKIVKYKIPNGFFITKSGFLYNPNGEVGDVKKGHKGGNIHLIVLKKI